MAEIRGRGELIATLSTTPRQTKMKNSALTLVSSLLASTTLQAAVIADLGSDYAAGIVGISPGDHFSENNWIFTGTDAVELDWFNAGTLGNNDPAGFGHPTSTLFGFELPAVSDSDLFDGGSVPAGLLALHAAGGANDLVITWTAPQNYTDLFVDYDYNRVGDNGAPGTGSSTLTIGGTAGVSLATIGVEADSVTNTVASVSAGETVVITITGAGGGEAAGNFIINGVPEPSSAAFLGLGGLALILRRRRK